LSKKVTTINPIDGGTMGLFVGGGGRRNDNDHEKKKPRKTGK